MGKKRRPKTTSEATKPAYQAQVVNEPKMSISEFVRQMKGYSSTFEDNRKKFAREVEGVLINDPSSSDKKRKNPQYSQLSRTTILEWLKDPGNNEKNLRNASIYLYQVSTRYRRLVQSIAQMHRLDYVISPLNFNPGKVDADKFKKAYYKASNMLELINLRDEGHKAITTAIRDGAYYGVLWLNSRSAFVQKLNPDYCQITSVSDGTFQFAYDCSALKEDTLEMYPSQFSDMYEEYQRSGNKWQPVPGDIAICLKEDSSILEYSIPPFVGAMPDLYEIQNAQELAKTAEELDNYKILYGQIEVDDKGKPTIDYNDMLQYYQMIGNNLSTRIGLAIGPFAMKDFSFERSGSATDVDLVARTVDNFWSSVGSSSVLHGAPNKTAGVTKLSLCNEETYVFALADQFARVINRLLKVRLSGSYTFKIDFLPITIFNQEEMANIYKGALNFGLAKSRYAAAIGIQMTDISGIDYIEDEVLNIDEALTPLKTSATGGGNDTEGAGRHEEDETDLDAEGEATRDSGANENR